MTRLAKGRDTHLLPDEIAREALRQFDTSPDEPSIRQLATALGVAPSAIYHHFGSRSEIVNAATEIVWEEVLAEMLSLCPNPLEADPVDALVSLGVAVRRTFGRHFRIAPYMAATPQGNPREVAALQFMAITLERMGLYGEDAGKALHAYSTFMFGSTLFAASRRIANERLALEREDGSPPIPAYPVKPARGEEGATLPALQRIAQLSTVDPAQDEELFAEGLRYMVVDIARYGART